MYFIIFILFVFFIVWSWNSTKQFETPLYRIIFLIIGTVFVTLVTLILFQISKSGVNYPKEEMIGEVRKIILLIFVPINGFILLTQGANIISQVKSGIVSKENYNRKIKILIVICIILIIFECIYFKSIQNDIIKVIVSRQ